MTRVVVAGLGDTGVLTAIGLGRHCDVLGVSASPGLVSGQELGSRLTAPDAWRRDYWVPFERYRRLRGVETVHGELTGLDPKQKVVRVRSGDHTRDLDYDVLVLATGVRNGFWRTGEVRTGAEVEDALTREHRTLAEADSIAIVGGGAAAVSVAANAASRWPDTRIDLYFPGERALAGHHVGTWTRVETILRDRGVRIHPGHRAVLPARLDRLTTDPIEWTSGQAQARADVVVWAVGRVEPNTDWIPGEMLDEHGFVRVGPTLQVPGHPEIFAVGDVAATDPLRGSARNRADQLVVRNVRALTAGRELERYWPRRRRWGSVIGLQPDGLTIYAPNGRGFRIPRWAVHTVLRPWIVDRGIYRGIRRA